MFAFDRPRPRRQPRLAPLVDLVFLLMMLLLLAWQQAPDHPMTSAKDGAPASTSELRLIVDILPDGMRFKGVDRAPRPLLLDLVALTESGEEVVALRPIEGTSVGRLLDVLSLMSKAGFGSLVVIEGSE